MDEFFDIEKEDIETFATALLTALILNGGKALTIKIKGKKTTVTAEAVEKCIDKDGNLDVEKLISKPNMNDVTQRLDVQDVYSTGKVSSVYEALEVTLRKQGEEVNENNINSLLNKINNGDYSSITRSYGAREYILSFTNSNGNITVINSVEDAIRATLQKQGKEINTTNINSLVDRINNGDYDCITRSYGARDFVQFTLQNNFNLNWIRNPKELDKAIEYLKINTNVQYDANEFRKMQYELFDKLKDSGMSDMDAAESVGRLFDSLVYDRGWNMACKYKGIKINVLNGSNIDISTVKDYINKLPKSLKKNIKEINISDLYNVADCYWSVEYGMPEFMSDATGGSGVINIFDSNNALKRSNYFETITHESGHCFDKDNKLSNSYEWEQAMIEDSKIPGNSIGCTEYATQAKNVAKVNSEDFAEAVSLYINNRSYFEINFPNRYKYLKNLIK